MSPLKLTTAYICITVLLNSFDASAQEVVPQLPPKATELLGKLSRFESTEALACEVRISNAHDSALAILAKQQKKAKDRGDLDAVLALRKVKEVSEGARPDPRLPAVAKATVEKFQSYAKAQRATLAGEISNKQLAVVRSLTRLVTDETKNDNVDVALAIRKEIDKLMAGKVESSGGVATKLNKQPDLFAEEPKLGRTLEKIWKAPGVVEVVGGGFVPLDPPEAASEDGGTEEKPKGAWVNIPPQLLGIGIQVHNASGPIKGVAIYKVKQPGYVMVACNYAYQGNNSGNWTDTRWKAEDFKNDGWGELEEKDMGGKLINSRGQDLRVFYKKLEAGDEGSLRCNKYGAPQFMTLPAASR